MLSFITHCFSDVIYVQLLVKGKGKNQAHSGWLTWVKSSNTVKQVNNVKDEEECDDVREDEWWIAKMRKWR